MVYKTRRIFYMGSVGKWRGTKEIRWKIEKVIGDWKCFEKWKI
jgi:hypothetical protein